MLNSIYKVLRKPTIVSALLKPSPQDLQEIAKLMSGGKLKMLVGNEFSFENIQQAFEYQPQRKGYDKTLIKF